MRELINNTALSFMLDLIFFALFQIMEAQLKITLPTGLYFLIGCVTMLYAASRKENYE